MTPLVSVIIPTFNREPFIVETLESVLNQTYTPLEIIVVDNGSTDGTIKLLESYAEKIRLIHEHKSGMGGSYARNAGLDAATGSFIAFLDSDDLWMASKIEKQVNFLNNNLAYGWCYTDLIGFDSDSGQHLYRYSQTRTMHTGDVLEQAFIQIFTPLSTLLIRKEVLDRVGQFWPTPKGTDADLAIRLAAESKVGFVSEILAHYRVHSESVTGRIGGLDAFEAGRNVKERAIELFPERLTPLRSQALASVASAVGLNFLKHGQNREARTMLGKAIAHQPSNIKLYTFYLSTFLNPSLLKSLNKKRRTI